MEWRLFKTYSRTQHTVKMSADNDDHEWFVFTRERPMHALEAAGQTEAPGYYDVDHRCIMKREDVAADVLAVCKHMHKECEAD